MLKNKRLIATLTAFSILLSTFLLVQPISLAAANSTGVDDNLEVLFESDYSDVTDYSSHRNDYYVDWGQSLAGNVFTQNIDGNGYIAYTQNTNSLGVIRLGHNYNTNTIGEYNYIEAIPGKTYLIEYDMKVYANYFAQSTPERLAQGWPQGGEDAYVGIAVANPTADIKGKDVRHYIADTKEFVSYYERVETFARYSNPDTSKWEGNVDGWVHKSVEFTVPSELDVSVNNAIQLFMGNGSRCQISFDNIKVSLVSSKEDLIFKNNYDDVPDYASHRNDYYVGWGHSLAGNAFPQNIDGNGYIAYTQNSNSLGVIRLGHNYKTNTIGEYNYVKAIPGKTYVIEYDMKVYANYFAIKTNKLDQGWPQGGEDAYVGIAVANPTADIAGKDVRHYIADTKEFVSYYERVDTFERYSNPDTSKWEGNVDGWVHKTVEFTVPADLDVSVNDAIQLFMGNGSRCQISFDNIKVSYKSDEVGDESVLADEDYSSANIAVDRPSKPFTNAYSDVLPVKDPSDDSNIVLEVRKNTAFCSFVYLGAQYKNKVEVTANTITVEPNTTYDISFDYKIVELDATKPDGTFNIGVCLTNANTTEGDPNKWYNNSFYKYEELFMTQDKVAVTDGWVNYKTSYTVTSKMDISEANKLAILCNVNTQRFAIYFDNVKVVKNDLVYTVKFDTAGGEEIPPITGVKGDPYVLPEKAVKEGCQFLGWYKDPEFLEEATNGTLDEAVTIIYAKFKKVQFDQGFEDDYAAFPIGKSDWFEYIYWYNTPREYRGDKAWAQWTDPNLKYQYNSDGVRSGDSSVYNPGTETAERLFTLLLKEPLIVGEQYTISMWVKVEDYTLPGDFRLWFNNGTWNSGKLRTEVDWTGGTRQVTLINSKAMKEHLGEWIEVKTDFVAEGKFAGIGTPGMTELYIDDVRITAKSVDASISRTVSGKGLVYEDWYDSNAADDDDVYVPTVDTEEKIIIKYAALEGLEEVIADNNINDNNSNNNNNNYSNDDYDDYNDYNNSNNSYFDSDNEDIQPDSENKPTGNKKVVRVKVKKPKESVPDESVIPVWPFIVVGAAIVSVIAGVTTAIVVTKRKSGSK